MNSLRLLLLPFSWIYGCITWIRNKLYDLNIFSSYEIPVNSICVGNLSMGGTGKTPHVDFLTRLFLTEGKQIAILSRGYGRQTKGYLEVTEKLNSTDVGDEPLSYKLKYGNKITVSVSENRENGIKQILKQYPKTNLIILDDAFQHRKVKANTNIILTDYRKLFSKDFVVPAGNLREFRSGKKRGDIIVVTKCPTNISNDEKLKSIKSLAVDKENVLFSSIQYGELVGFKQQELTPSKNALVVTGIASPTPLINHLEKSYNIEHLKYNDHHAFSPKDIEEISRKFNTFAQEDKIIITTEKDFMRLKDIGVSNPENWYYQSITTMFENQEKLNDLLNRYVRRI